MFVQALLETHRLKPVLLERSCGACFRSRCNSWGRLDGGSTRRKL